MVLHFDPGAGVGAIGSLEELILAMDKDPRPAGYMDAMLRLDMGPGPLEPFCRWNTRHYTRQCIHRTGQHELLLICYEAGQRTSIHDYDSQMAWIKPVTGIIQEERFKIEADGQLKRHGTRLLLPGKLAYMASRNCIQRHSNPGGGRAITLNLYARPLRSWRMYNERTGLVSLGGPAGGRGA